MNWVESGNSSGRCRAGWEKKTPRPHLYFYAHAHAQLTVLSRNTRRRSHTDDLLLDSDRLAWARGWLARSEHYDRQINANFNRTLEALVDVTWIDGEVHVCVDVACIVCLVSKRVQDASKSKSLKNQIDILHACTIDTNHLVASMLSEKM